MSEHKDELDCLDNCWSVQHGKEICSIASAATDIRAVYLWVKKCSNYAHVQDEFGRTALHVVASTGNIEALEWLIKRAGGNIDKKDRISGHTPLHRSIYYGKIHIARSLIQFNADVNLKDNEGMTAFELCNADCPREFSVNIKSDPTELFVWGSNDNYTLGSTTQQTRPVPEQLEFFRKNNTRIMQAIISTYHSIFLTQLGEIFVCGSSRHGRLGLGHDKSVFQPESLPIKSSAKCISVAAGVDHTLFLMENGRVLSCGSNEYGVSGQKEGVLQSLVPKTVEIPGKINIEGILATRYHSVFYTAHKIFTCGLNRGQLGLLQDKGPFIYEPKVVSQIMWDPEGETHFTHFATSTCATIARANTGIIYVLHKFECIKVNAKQFDVTKLQVAGGSFGENHVEKYGKLPTVNDENLVVLLLTSTGRIIIWRLQLSAQRTGTGVFSRVIFNSGRVLNIADISLCQSSLLLVSNRGEAYKSLWKPLCDPQCIPNWQLRHQNNNQHTVNDFQISTGSRRPQKGKDSSNTVGFLEHMKLQRVKNVYSALRINSDDQGKNFAIIQSSPKTELTSLPIVSNSELHLDLLKFLEESNEEDSMHDVLLKVGNRKFPVHLYIIASGAPKLHSIIVTKLKKTTCSSNGDPKIVNVDNMNENVFQQILQFIYSHTCDLLMDGKKIPDCYSQGQDIMKLTMESARRLDLENLCKLLKKFTIINNEVRLKASELRLELTPRRFKRNVNEDLCDIMLQSQDLKIFKAHKCILVARSEYFYSMLFANVWLEQSSDKPIQMQFSGLTLEIFLNYIYEDNVIDLPISDFDVLSEILAMSDNLFMQRLRTLIEAALADILTLKNVVSMLYLADRCNAEQLKETCMQFICINLALVLETRLMDPLPLDLVKDLSTYYCSFHEQMRSRSIKPPSTGPIESDFIQGLKNISPELINEIEASYLDEEIRKPTVKTTKNKPRLRSRVSESESHEIANVSTSSDLVNDDPLSPTSSTTYKPNNTGFMPNQPSLHSFTGTGTQKVVQPLRKHAFPNPGQTMMQLRNAEANEALKAKRNLNPSEFPSLKDIESPLSEDGRSGNLVWRTSVAVPSPSPKPGVKLLPIDSQRHAPNTNKSSSGHGNGKKKTKWKSVDLKNVSEAQSPSLILGGDSPSKKTEPSRDPKNPWKIDEAKNKLVFREIVEDEVEKKANLERAITKPLNLMQIEDQAINQLTTRYHSADVEDGIEIVTVERLCSTNFAPPVWVSHSSFNMPKS